MLTIKVSLSMYLMWMLRLDGRVAIIESDGDVFDSQTNVAVVFNEVSGNVI